MFTKPMKCIQCLLVFSLNLSVIFTGSGCAHEIIKPQDYKKPPGSSHSIVCAMPFNG